MSHFAFEKRMLAAIYIMFKNGEIVISPFFLVGNLKLSRLVLWKPVVYKHPALVASVLPNTTSRTVQLLNTFLESFNQKLLNFQFVPYYAAPCSQVERRPYFDTLKTQSSGKQIFSSSSSGLVATSFHALDSVSSLFSKKNNVNSITYEQFVR